MTEEPEHVAAPGCGRQLRRTREQLGLSVDDVASELRLSGFQIRALEDDDWDPLPGNTYARGYLRSYARLLGLDAEQLMAGASTQEIELTRTQPGIAARTTGDDEVPPEPSRRFPWGWVSVVLVVAVLAVGYWQYRADGASTPDVARPDGATTPDGAAGPRDDRAAAARGEAPAESAVADDAATPDVSRMPTAPRKAVFQFKERSWIDVRDGSGDRLLYRNFPPGRRIEIEGEPPFRVFVGNARAVQVEYMGDIRTPGTGSGRIYARFVLGAPSG